MVSDWEPACSVQLLRYRAQMLSRIRHYFSEQGVLEVETPLLGHAVGTDPNLDFFSCEYVFAPEAEQLFLQTSPEFAMKRLLASGSGSIFQVCKAFRNGESGRYHNPEFSLLEWYRVGADLSLLMDDITQLVTDLLQDTYLINNHVRQRYADVFFQHTGLDALQFSYPDYVQCAAQHQLLDAVLLCADNHAMWLDFLFSQLVQPQLQGETLYLLYDYPACLPSLAKTHPDNPLLVQRVEIFINGVELGNGYHELSDVKEQRRRFEQEIDIRQRQGFKAVAADEKLLQALASGLPDCSGMAIGLDRLLMLATGSGCIADVLAFPVQRA